MRVGRHSAPGVAAASEERGLEGRVAVVCIRPAIPEQVAQPVGAGEWGEARQEEAEEGAMEEAEEGVSVSGREYAKGSFLNRYELQPRLQSCRLGMAHYEQRMPERSSRCLPAFYASLSILAC